MSECQILTANARNAYTQFRDGNIALHELVNQWEYWFQVLVTRSYNEIYEFLMLNWEAKRMSYSICIECIYGDQLEECIAIFKKEKLL